jgi:hypothetical protein
MLRLLSFRRPATIRGRLVLSVTALLLLGSVMTTIGVTLSAFSAAAGSPAALQQAGSVVLTDNDSSSAMFSMSGMTPGSTDTGCIQVTSTGTLPSLVKLYGTTTGTGLDPYLDVTVTRGTVSSGSFDSCTGFTADTTNYLGLGAGVLFDDTLQAFPDSYAAGIADPRTATVPEAWTSGEVHAYKLTVTLENNAAAANKTANQTFTWEARNTTQYSQVILSDQPAGYWTLDEAAGTSAADATGTDNATYTNGPVLNQTSRVKDANTAVSFDGSNDRIAAGDLYDFGGTGAFTVEAWVRPTAATASWRPIVSKQENASNNPGWVIQLRPSSQSPANSIKFQRKNAAGTIEAASSTTALAAGTWYHVVGTYDGTTLKVYVNGSLEGSGASAIVLPDHTRGLRIGGAAYNDTIDSFGGLIDEVAMYSYALSATQVSEHWIAGQPW